jgi:type VI secretion system secreted protein VgrG
MPLLELTFPSGGPSFDVRRFSIREAIGAPFTVALWAVCDDPAIDLSALLGKAALFRLADGWDHARAYRGVCRAAAQTQAEPTGLSSYELTIVPALWLLSQRRDIRIFQHKSVPEIVAAILDEWQVPATWAMDRAAYPALEYRVQHGESDLAFVSRLLEEAGITYTFAGDDAGTLVLSDAPHRADPRPGPPIHFVDNPSRAVDGEYVTRVCLAREARPGAIVLRDHDPRSPAYALFGRAAGAGIEARLERYGYAPGGSVIEGEQGGGTPVADDQGVARASEAHLGAVAALRLEEQRLGERAVTFASNVPDLAPGTVFSIARHPAEALAEDRRLLVTDLAVDGTPGETWDISGRAVLAGVPFRPPRSTPRPRALGLATAVVVGPRDQEIHADELGRVRVRFPWDRSGKSEDHTSCWLRVGHGWAGAGFGWMALPRVGDEVIVSFLDGDPDQPVILRGAHNGVSGTPHPLPAFADASAWKSASTPGSDGYNEILFRDVTARELVYTQAERDETRLVRYDETVTVVQRRSALVKGDASETTGKERIRVTGGARKRRVNGERSARAEGTRKRRLGGKLSRLVHGSARTRVDGDEHAWVHGEARIQVEGKDSLAVGGDRHEVAAKRHGIDVGSDVHLRSNDDGVFEAVQGITFKTPGGFVVIDAGGITIFGALVKINSGGAAGSGGGASPDDPAPPREVDRFDPPMPYEGAMPDGEVERVEAEPELPDDLPPPVELTWIEIHLVDAEGEPVGGERYRVIAPDKKVFEGNLDGDGRARVEGIVPGTCQVTFPDVDEEDWS